MMFKLKNFFTMLLAVLLTFSLTSCIGIGDGALIGDFEIPDQSVLNGDNLPTSDGSYYTSLVSIYDAQGEKLSECYFEKADVNEFWELLLHGEYQKGIDRTAIEHPYVELQFFHMDKDGNLMYAPQNIGMYAGVHRIYSDDYVIQRDTSNGTIINGHLDGAYQKIFDLIASKGNSAGYLCEITLDAMNGVYTRFEAAGDSVLEIYDCLENGEYETGLERTAEEKACFTLTFWGSKSGTYNIWSDDHVGIYNAGVTSPEASTIPLQQLGRVDGIYNRVQNMLVAELRSISSDEKAAGCKLNSLIVSGNWKQLPTVADFSDIGCIYVEELYSSDTAIGAILYFDSCSVAELEEKIAILEAREDVGIVSKSTIRTYDNPAYD